MGDKKNSALGIGIAAALTACASTDNIKPDEYNAEHTGDNTTEQVTKQEKASNSGAYIDNNGNVVVPFFPNLTNE